MAPPLTEGLNVIMSYMVEVGLFSGYKVGRNNPMQVSQLQFVDDTPILGEKSRGNVHVMRATLILFQRVSGLKVNFHKCMLVDIHVAGS